MHQLTFVPVTPTTIEFRSGKKLLATIMRQRNGSHFCTIEDRTNQPFDEKDRVPGKLGFHEPTLEKAKQHVRERLVV